MPDCEAVVEDVAQLATYVEKMKEGDFVEIEYQEAENGITLAYDNVVQEYLKLANKKKIIRLPY